VVKIIPNGKFIAGFYQFTTFPFWKITAQKLTMTRLMVKEYDDRLGEPGHQCPGGNLKHRNLVGQYE